MSSRLELTKAAEDNNADSLGLHDIGRTAKYRGSGDIDAAPQGDGKIYDPHEHRQNEAPTTNNETLIHLLKGSLGTGILAMPHAFYKAGLVNGFIGTVLIGSLCTYCLHVLVRSQYELCKRLRVPILSYPRTMEVALQQGPEIFRGAAGISGPIVNVFLIVYQLGICCVYIVFVATNIKQVCDHYVQPLDVRLYMLMLLLPLILISYIKNLKVLAPFSTVANIITFIGIAMVMYYLFDNIPSPSTRNFVGSPRDFPLFVGTTLFALEAVGVIIALENNMEQPVAFTGYCGVLNRGMSVIISLYILVGFVGYVKYGSGALGSITLNIPTDEVPAQCVKVMFAFAIFVTYALQGYVPVEIMWNTYIKKRMLTQSKTKQFLVEYAMRTTMVILTFLLAVAIPHLELFISLFGALCLSALGIAFPALIEMCLLWPNNYGRFQWIFVKDVILIICGILGLVIGTYTSLADIIHSMVNEETGIANNILHPINDHHTLNDTFSFKI